MSEENLQKKPPLPPLIPREEWGARPPCGKVLAHSLPVSNVIVMWTDQRSCETKESCQLKLRELQKDHMYDQGFTDIQYNFMIGGEGNIYEGRGWDKAPSSLPKTVKNAEQFNGKMIQIGLIELNNRKPPEKSMTAVSSLMASGIILGYVEQQANMYLYKDDQLHPVDRSKERPTTSKIKMF